MKNNVPRYYVEPPKYAEVNVVVRDRISPIRDAAYPADIIVEVWTPVAGSKAAAIKLAERICKILNEGKLC